MIFFRKNSRFNTVNLSVKLTKNYLIIKCIPPAGADARDIFNRFLRYDWALVMILEFPRKLLCHPE